MIESLGDWLQDVACSMRRRKRGPREPFAKAHAAQRERNAWRGRRTSEAHAEWAEREPALKTHFMEVFPSAFSLRASGTQTEPATIPGVRYCGLPIDHPVWDELRAALDTSRNPDPKRNQGEWRKVW